MPIAAHHRTYAAFFLFAVTSGAFLSRIPDLQTRLAINKSELGLTLIGLAIGSLISLTFSSPIIMKLGARLTLAITLLGTAALLAITPYLPDAPAVFAVLFLTGLLGGAFEINLNLEIGRIEAQSGFSFMNRAHGFWSVGFFITAMTAAFIRQAEIPVAMHLFAILVCVCLAGAVILNGMTGAPDSNAEKPKMPLFAMPTLGLAPLCLIGIAAFLVEGAGIDWSAIYMRDVFAAEPFIGGSGLTLFAFFMALARLVVDPIIDRVGARRVAVVLLLIASGGGAMVWLAPTPWIALAGFALMGAGCSAVYPMAVSAAAQRKDRPSAVNVAAVSQMSFVVFFLAPPFLGFIAEAFGIRNAYLACLPLIIASIFATSSLTSEGRAEN